MAKRRESNGKAKRSCGAGASRFRRVSPTAECSEYYRGAGNSLDHVAVTASSREVPAAARVTVEGYCGEVGCARLDKDAMPRAYRELSDHCPLVVEVDDRDLD